MNEERRQNERRPGEKVAIGGEMSRDEKQKQEARRQEK